MSVDIAQIIDEIKKDAVWRRSQPLHPDREKLAGKPLRIRPTPMPFRKKLISVLKRERLGIVRRIYHVPFIGYFLKWCVTILRLPTRIRQLTHNQNEILHRINLNELSVLKIQNRQVVISTELHSIIDLEVNKTIEILRGELNNIQVTLQEKINSHSKIIIDNRDLIQSFSSCTHREISEKSITRQATSESDNHSLDRFYYEFEERFRGPQDQIQKKQRHYLRFFSDHAFDFRNEQILDVGCGRGEWLQALTQQGYRPKGLDLNRIMIEECTKKGLEVELKDVVDYLQSLKSESLGALTGFHIAEHLPFRTLIQLIDETLRVLKPGGMIILETPNPENLITGACNFYVDPTHRNPLPPSTLAFFLEQRGFVGLDVQRLSPVDRQHTSVDPLVEDLAQWFYREQDYGIIAYKP